MHKYEIAPRSAESYLASIGYCDSRVYSATDIAPMMEDYAAERCSKAEARVRELNAELDAGDSWAWIREKFKRSKDKFRWYTPRSDDLKDTRYEVMGWLHCLFSDADPKVFIDITLEHQKRTDEAEARVRELEAENTRLRNSLEVECDAFRNMLLQRDGLRDQVERLKAPVSDAEWKAFSTTALLEGCVESDEFIYRDEVNSLIASRTAHGGTDEQAR
jgi:hypothetical protein